MLLFNGRSERDGSARQGDSCPGPDVCGGGICAGDGRYGSVQSRGECASTSGQALVTATDDCRRRLDSTTLRTQEQGALACCSPPARCCSRLKIHAYQTRRPSHHSTTPAPGTRSCEHGTGSDRDPGVSRGLEGRGWVSSAAAVSSPIISSRSRRRGWSVFRLLRLRLPPLSLTSCSALTLLPKPVALPASTAHPTLASAIPSLGPVLFLSLSLSIPELSPLAQEVARLIFHRHTPGAAAHRGAWAAHLDDRPPDQQRWRDLDQACCHSW